MSAIESGASYFEPLTNAISRLRGAIEKYESGYVAVLGPPGSGKSTMLDQSVPHGGARVVRYLLLPEKLGFGALNRCRCTRFVHSRPVPRSISVPRWRFLATEERTDARNYKSSAFMRLLCAHYCRAVLLRFGTGASLRSCRVRRRCASRLSLSSISRPTLTALCASTPRPHQVLSSANAIHQSAIH